eukprot:SAG31_NODE_1517_length_8031_cov_18.008699_7_plen_35_part_00
METIERGLFILNPSAAKAKKTTDVLWEGNYTRKL